MKKLVFLLLLAFGSAWNCNAQSWTYVQDSVITFCTGGSATCNVSQSEILPTVPGSVWVVRVHTPNNVTITSVSGGGGTWQLCPASSCHLFDSALGDNQDLAYNLSGNAGTVSVTVNLSGAAGSFFGMNFIELLPPSGTSASFDTAGTTTSSNCTNCTGPALTLAGTDAVIQVLSGNGGSVWNAWSSPYITDIASDGINLSATSGAAATVKVGGSGGDITAIAFKTSPNITAPPPGPISMANYTRVAKTNCNSGCPVTIPATSSGHLLYLQAASLGPDISSVSGGGSWIVPSACGISVSSAGQNAHLSCAYLLSSAANVTSVNVTTTSGGSVQLGIYELASTSGVFTLDAIGSTINPASFYTNMQPLTLASGANDAIFQAAFVPGGPNGASFYPYALGNANFMLNEAGSAALLNVSTAPAAKWGNGQSLVTIVTGVAFKTATGTGTAPAPPTGLTAVVN